MSSQIELDEEMLHQDATALSIQMRCNCHIFKGDGNARSSSDDREYDSLFYMGLTYGGGSWTSWRALELSRVAMNNGIIKLITKAKTE